MDKDLQSDFLEQRSPTSETNKRSKAARHFKLAKLDKKTVESILVHDTKAAAELANHTNRRRKIAVSSYFDFMVNELALKRNNQDFYNGLSFDKAPYTPPPVHAFCDYIRCTNTSTEHYQDFCSKAFPYFTKAGFDIVDTGHGLNGYPTAWVLKFEGAVAGHFCVCDRMGGLFELTGFGCRLVQANWDEWRKLTWSLCTLGFKLTRLDISVDFAGYDWFHYDVTLPEILNLAKTESMFSVGRAFITPKINTYGDWSDLSCGSIGVSDYNPSVHAPAGLTFDVGKRGGHNQFVVYEKGKEQVGRKLVKSLTEVEASAVRIERRFGRGSAGKTRVEIDWNFAVLFDEAFVYNCVGLEKFLNDFVAFKGGRNPPAKKGIKIERIVKVQSNSLVKKAFHSMQQSGKFINTLIHMGFSSDFVVNLLINKDKLVEGFVDDLTHCKDLALAFAKVKAVMYGGASYSSEGRDVVSSSGKAEAFDPVAFAKLKAEVWAKEFAPYEGGF